MRAKVPCDEEESEILQSSESGALKPVSDMAQLIKDHQGAAEAAFKKDQHLNLRISSTDPSRLVIPPPPKLPKQVVFKQQIVDQCTARLKPVDIRLHFCLGYCRHYKTPRFDRKK